MNYDRESVERRSNALRDKYRNGRLWPDERRSPPMEEMTRAEYDREVYDHERQRGEHAEDEDPFAPNEREVLHTYTLQLLGPPSHQAVWPYVIPQTFLQETEENLTDLLPEGYSVKIGEWDHE